ncbi:unnamed protein product [Durusdinium trenchii]|uniref:UBA domain-containing protein n=2 Tax=Durusdinium trenchii TaxID=1381693 RepID=A0ABP0QQ68_9DINO
MLMRSSTRIEFRVEDAQEYIKARERQKRPGQGHTCTLPPVPGASREDDAYPTSRSSTAMSPIDRAPSAEEEVEEAQPSRTESAHHEVSEPDHFQSEVEQLAVLGIDEQDARRALRATGGDLEAAADRLLL